MDRQSVVEALDPILSALRVDGSIVDVASVEADRVVVSLHQSTDCEACVMNRESLEAILTECLKEAGLAGSRVTVLES